MWCGQCKQDLSRCTCPDLKDRIAALNKPGTHVFIKTCIVCGEHYARCKCTNAILCEDGLEDLVEIVRNTSDHTKDEYTLKHVEHLNHDHCALTVGQEFTVMQLRGYGAWGGMWSLERAVKRV